MSLSPKSLHRSSNSPVARDFPPITLFKTSFSLHSPCVHYLLSTFTHHGTIRDRSERHPRQRCVCQRLLLASATNDTSGVSFTLCEKEKPRTAESMTMSHDNEASTSGVQRVTLRPCPQSRGCVRTPAPLFGTDRLQLSITPLLSGPPT